MLLEVELLYPFTVKTILSVRCYEQQTAFPVKMAGRVKGTPANSLFGIRYRVIRSLLFSILISQPVGGSHQAVSAFQPELRVFTVQTVFT